MIVCYGAKLEPEFIKKVYSICVDDFKWPEKGVNYLIASMAFETGETFNPAIQNASTKATGLIQFMPATLAPMKLTVDTIAQMTAIEQLDLVQKYFKPYAEKIRLNCELSSVYMAILYPKYIVAPGTQVVFDKDTKAYAQNKGLDLDADGVVTKDECASKVSARLTRGLSANYMKAYNLVPKNG